MIQNHLINIGTLLIVRYFREVKSVEAVKESEQQLKTHHRNPTVHCFQQFQFLSSLLFYDKGSP
jgi:hypothetical protein